MKSKKETYLYRETDLDYFDQNYKKFLDSRIENEIDFIDDLIKSLDLFEIEKILAKYHHYNFKKEIEFINYVTSNVDYFYYHIDLKAIHLKSKYFKASCDLSLGKYFIYLVKEYLEAVKNKDRSFKLPLTNSYNALIIKTLEHKIITTRGYIVAYLDLVTNPTGIDVLNSYLIFDRSKANNFMGKSGILESQTKRLDFEITLDKWTINIDGKLFIPHIILHSSKDSVKKGAFEIELIPISEIIQKVRTYIVCNEKFEPKVSIGDTDIKNRKLFIRLLCKLFRFIEPKISSKECDIFIYSISQDCLEKYSYEEVGTVRYKINELLKKEYGSEKKKAKLLFCAFIYMQHKKEEIRVNRLIDALSDYFNQRHGLSKGTLIKYIYSKETGEENYLIYENDLNEIIGTYLKSLKKVNSYIENKKKVLKHSFSVD